MDNDFGLGLTMIWDWLTSLRWCPIGINHFWLVGLVEWVFLCSNGEEHFSAGLVDQLFQLVSNQVEIVEKALAWLCCIIAAHRKTISRSNCISTVDPNKTWPNCKNKLICLFWFYDTQLKTALLHAAFTKVKPFVTGDQYMGTATYFNNIWNVFWGSIALKRHWLTIPVIPKHYCALRSQVRGTSR